MNRGGGESNYNPVALGSEMSQSLPPHNPSKDHVVIGDSVQSTPTPVDNATISTTRNPMIRVLRTRKEPRPRQSSPMATPSLAERTAMAPTLAGMHTGAAGVGAGARTLLTLKWMTPKPPASRSTLSGSTPEGGAGCECGCPPHPAAHIGHTADAIPLLGDAATFPPPGGYPRRCSHAMGRARACASSSLGFPTNLLS